MRLPGTSTRRSVPKLWYWGVILEFARERKRLIQCVTRVDECNGDFQQMMTVGRALCHTKLSVDHEVPYSVAVSSRVDRLRWPCNAVVRLARKARGMASGDKAEAAASVATLAPEVRACLVSYGVRARPVSRIIGLSPPNCNSPHRFWLTAVYQTSSLKNPSPGNLSVM